MIKYSYEEIYGVTLSEYLKEQNLTSQDLIQKIKKDIELLKKRLNYLIGLENEQSNSESTYLINNVYYTIQKKEKHLSRIEEWRRNEIHEDENK